jgi:hypothetical protein
MNHKNFWGEPDDIEPLPDWMNPETARRYNQIKRRNKSMNESILEALRKPPVPIIIKDPTE